MAKKITLGTLELILKEVDEASNNKARVISDIQNFQVRQIIQDYSEHALKHGIPALGIVAGFGAAGAAVGVAGGVGGAAAGAGTATILSVVGGSAAAVEGAAAGATAGSVVPIVGTLIGAGVGLLVGGLIGGTVIAKQKQKRECLYQEALKIQNGKISALESELKSLNDKINKKDTEIARFEYLAGVLSSYEATKAALAA